MESRPANLSIAKFDAIGIAYSFTGKGAVDALCARPQQVHGVDIVRCDTPQHLPTPMTTPADGIFTTTKGVCVGVVTADCLPILIADRHRRCVMALHAGWRGLTAGIINRGMETLLSLELEPEDILVAIGPAIGPRVYEVGPEVMEATRSPQLGLSSPQQELVLRQGRDDRWFLDLQKAAVLAFCNLDIPVVNVQAIPICTFENHDRWHSYRYEQGRAGRNFATISL